eukprot:Sspe_Gene.73279::Locus_44119_Transcript_1_1_Confidence_1.000_Length_2171::g.73279::m.73279
MLHDEDEEGGKKWEEDISRKCFQSIDLKVEKKATPHVLVVCDKPLRLRSYMIWLSNIGCTVEGFCDARKCYLECFEGRRRARMANGLFFDCVFVELADVPLGTTSEALDMQDFIRYVRDTDKLYIARSQRSVHHPMVAVCNTTCSVKNILQAGYDYFIRAPFIRSLGNVRKILLPQIYHSRERAKIGRAQANYGKIEVLFHSLLLRCRAMLKNLKKAEYNDEVEQQAMAMLMKELDQLKEDIHEKDKRIAVLEKGLLHPNSAEHNTKLLDQLRDTTAELVKYKAMYQRRVDDLVNERVKTHDRTEVRKMVTTQQEQPNQALLDELTALRATNDYLQKELTASSRTALDNEKMKSRMNLMRVYHRKETKEMQTDLIGTDLDTPRDERIDDEWTPPTLFTHLSMLSKMYSEVLEPYFSRWDHPHVVRSVCAAKKAMVAMYTAACEVFRKHLTTEEPSSPVHPNEGVGEETERKKRGKKGRGKDRKAAEENSELADLQNRVKEQKVIIQELNEELLQSFNKAEHLTEETRRLTAEVASTSKELQVAKSREKALLTEIAEFHEEGTSPSPPAAVKPPPSTSNLVAELRKAQSAADAREVANLRERIEQLEGELKEWREGGRVARTVSNDSLSNKASTPSQRDREEEPEMLPLPAPLQDPSPKSGGPSVAGALAVAAVLSEEPPDRKARWRLVEIEDAVPLSDCMLDFGALRDH